MQNKCHVCDNREIVSFDSYPGLYRVTSDCRPWKRGGSLGICRRCNTVQVFVSERWLDEIESIYTRYEVYHQGDGSEQAIFISGVSHPRSERIMSGLIQNASLPDRGRLLDIGCGNGSFLRAFHSCQPLWSISGSELNDHDRTTIESIPGFDALWCSSPKEIPGTYDCISMIHLLEHIISPVSFLQDVRERLSDNGIIVIELPNFLYNPFDLIIADHATHFSMDSIRYVLEEAGFEITWSSETWVPKEITIIAGKKLSSPGVVRARREDQDEQVERTLKWLKNLKTEAEELAENGSIGIFGSSIAATWMYAELGGNVSFFIDEDPSRIGRKHLGRPILSPAGIPTGSRIMIPAPQEIKESIQNRLKM